MNHAICKILGCKVNVSAKRYNFGHWGFSLSLSLFSIFHFIFYLFIDNCNYNFGKNIAKLEVYIHKLNEIYEKINHIQYKKYIAIS